MYQENTSDEWDIPWYTTRKRCITILYHAMKMQWPVGKVGCYSSIALIDRWEDLVEY